MVFQKLLQLLVVSTLVPTQEMYTARGTSLTVEQWPSIQGVSSILCALFECVGLTVQGSLKKVDAFENKQLESS